MANVVNMTESRILWETDLVACLWGIILNALIKREETCPVWMASFPGWVLDCVRKEVERL